MSLTLLFFIPFLPSFLLPQALRAQRDKSLVGQELDNDLDLIASLLPLPRTYEDFIHRTREDDEHEDIRRELIGMTIRLSWARANQALADLASERDLLEKAPKEGNEDEERAEYDARDKQKGKGKADGTWKLDGSRWGGPDGKGALLDAEGKVSFAH